MCSKCVNNVLTHDLSCQCIRNGAVGTEFEPRDDMIVKAFYINKAGRVVV